MDNNFYNKVTNSWLYSLGDKIADLLILSVLWIVFCIPVLTAIPSTSALYYAVYKTKESDESVAKLFMRSFKRNLKQGVVLNILFLLYSLIAFLCIFLGYHGIGDIKFPDMYFPFSFVTLIPIIFTWPFTVALLARFDNKIKTTLTNSFTLSTINIFGTLGIWVILIATLVIMVLFFPSALVLPAISCKFIVPMCEKAFGYARNAENQRNATETISGNMDTDSTETDIEDEE